jgi:DNA-binding SARP family transcriptional activator/tetratricopeptide (TPR) repeat protein
MSDQDAPTALRFEVLGPLRAWRAESPLDLGPARQRVVLAVLLLHANKPLGREQLIDAVWGPAAPAHAVNLLQRHVSALRRVLEPGRPPWERSPLLTWTDAGYLLTVPKGHLDLSVFERELARARGARAARDLPGAREALHAALRLWRGPPCDGLVSPLLEVERDRLAEQRISAMEDRLEVDLALGHHLDVVGELRHLVTQHPLRERLRGLLMLALYRSGRQAEAFAAFHAARRYLGEELGVEPSAQLQQMHEKILATDPTLDLSAAIDGVLADAVPEARRELPPPAQLPHRIPDFTGRDAELQRLQALTSADDDDLTDGSALIIAIAGTAGVGKTALAVHWAHQIRHRYPDGQLYVNLRGFDPTGSAMDPAEAIRGFLDAFGLPPQRIPVGLTAQTALYRSLLADRRVLAVLDNARDADQVRPLLPGSSGCLVVVTSRNQLAGLVVGEGAYPLKVDLLPVHEAGEMLRRRLGPGRLWGEPEAVGEIIAGCAGLPLALAIVAARAATNPQFPFATFADDLRRARGGLDVLAGGGDASIDVRAVFDCSYRTVSAEAARVFRLLGLYAGPDISTAAAASLAGVEVQQVRPALAELARAHLIEEQVPGRYTFHDLLRAYAAELAYAHTLEEERREVVQRVLDYYLHSAYAAALELDPHRESIGLSPPQRGVIPEQFPDSKGAMAWLTTEHAVLIAAVDQAASIELDTYAWQLAWTLTDFLDRRGHWQDRVATQGTALAAAQRAADERAQAHAHRYLGYAYAKLDRDHDAEMHLHRALDLYDRLGDQIGKARTHDCFTEVCGRDGRHEEALEHARRALDLYRAAYHTAGQAHALNSVGWHLAQLGDHRQALTYCDSALALHEGLGISRGQAHTWDSLGYVHQHLGHHQQAIASYTEALALYRDLGERYYEAATLVRLGEAHHAEGRLESSRAAWQEALTILRPLSPPEADRVREKLLGLGQTSSALLSPMTGAVP